MTKENDQSKRLPYGLIAKTILGAIGVAGIVGVGLAVPGAFQIAKLFQFYNKKTLRRYQTPAYIRKTVKTLERQGLVRVLTKKGGAKVFITGKGEQELLKYQLQEKRLHHERWDKKWRIIIFDIEEKRRAARDGVRNNMESFGFVKLQDSVWVYPFECEEVVTLLKTHYKVGRQLVYIVAGDIENDEWLRKKFHLDSK